jgi:2-methylcitrate dehydratase PrpD
LTITFDSGLLFSCGATHCGIEAALKLRSEHKISATDILEVELSTHPMLPEVAFSHEPETVEEAKVSAEYCVSRALINGNILLSDFTPEAVMDPETQKLLRKVRFLPATDKKEKYNLATGVTVRMCDGKVYSKRIEIPKGAPENPLTSEELYGKFKACASSLLCANDVEKISILVSKLDQLMDIGELMYLLVQEDRATIYG